MGVEFWSWIFAIAVLLVLGGIGAMFTKPDELADKMGGDAIPVDALSTYRTLAPGTYSAVLVRQSGNLHRDLGTFPPAQAALAEATKSFRRAKVEYVRITHASDTELAAYRQFYNLRGRAEGKKFAGIRLVRVSAAQAPAPPKPRPVTSYEHVTSNGLRVQLLSVTKGEGDRYNILVDYICTKCGGEVGTDGKLPSESLKCPSCGSTFGRLDYIQKQHRDLVRQYLVDGGLPAAKVNDAPI